MEDHSKINCPDCGQAIAYANINIKELVAKCDGCQTIFSFANQFADTPAPRPKKRRIEIPEQIEVLRLSEHLDINVPWRDKITWGLLFFTVFWNIIVMPFAIFALISGQFGMLLGLSAHLAIGISFGLFYTCQILQHNKGGRFKTLSYHKTRTP